MVLVIGTDWPSGTSFPGSNTAPAPVDTQATLDGANVKLGNDNATCAQVSTFKTAIGLDASGKPTSSDHPTSSTTPTRAYALSPEVKDSAPREATRLSVSGLPGRRSNRGPVAVFTGFDSS
jgi:hypothetical protein